MLLGAAKYLAETRNFAGSVAVIFQPAEEGGGGGNEMVKDGMMERFGIEKVFGMHNMPGLPVGQFAIRPGPIMAATAEFTITVQGQGGHAAMPHRTIDPIVIGSQLVGALQTIASRIDRSGRFGGRVGDQVPWRRRLQRHSRTGRARRHGAHAAQGSGGQRRSERLRAICAGIAAAFGADDPCRLRRQLSRHRQPSGRNGLRQRRRRRRSPATPMCTAPSSR